MVTAFIALGSNLASPANQIRQALLALSELPDSTLVASSKLYQNPPQGLLNQPDFINAVAELKTHLAPETLLAALLAIEQQHNRVRTEKNGPRTLDLDLLLYGNEQIDQANLTVPHPRMTERAFVIYPLAEIAPDLILPHGPSIISLLATFDNPNLQVVHD